nr:protein lin-9 homolog [Aedes albopictus]XP_019548862.2 protein lin-9 homolog [Aedes albopictus]
MKDSLKKRKEDPDEGTSSTPLRVINPIALLDKKASQRIGLRLRNLLKLPKPHKFVSYEWFYSNIDRALFEGENDFQMCLREMYPDLKTRHLTRAEWNRIRRDAFRLSGILAGELYDGWTRLFAELFCAVCVCEK